MIDISDGLLIDLSRLCDESGIGARIYEEKIPLSAEIKETASCFGIDPLGFALSGGEDYELLFTVPAGTNIKAIYIGDVIKSGRLMVDRSGKNKPISAEGYRHFGKRKDI
jgi:thiamine-monophosphate kinase